MMVYQMFSFELFKETKNIAVEELVIPVNKEEK